MHKLLGGIPVKFTGTATDNKKGKSKVITGTATPSTHDKGSVTFSVQTDNGLMAFNTSYHFGKRGRLLFYGTLGNRSCRRRCRFFEVRCRV